MPKPALHDEALLARMRAFVDGIGKGNTTPRIWYSDRKKPVAGRAYLGTAETVLLDSRGIVMKANSGNVHPVIGSPSYALAHEDGTRALGFLFREPLGGEELERYAPLIESKTGHPPLDQMSPIPGVDGWRWLRGEAEAATGFTRHDVADLMSRLEKLPNHAEAESSSVSDNAVNEEQSAVTEPEVAAASVEVANSATPEFIKADDGSFSFAHDPANPFLTAAFESEHGAFRLYRDAESKARIYKDSPERGELKLTVTFGANSKANKNLKVVTDSWMQVVQWVSDHREGPKDGIWISFVESRDGMRGNEFVEGIYGVVADIDVGMSRKDITARALTKNVHCVLSSTRSHLTQTTKIPEKGYRKNYADKGITDAAAILRAEKGYEEHVLVGARIGNVVEEKEFGKEVAYRIFHHASCEKWRKFVPFAKPILVSDYLDENGQPDREAFKAAWKARYRAICADFDLPYDESCSDPARIFYLGRHAKDAEWVSLQIVGKGFYDPHSPEVEALIVHDPAPAKRAKAGGSKGTAGDRTVQPRAPVSVDGFDFTKWVATFGGHFLIVDALKAHKPDALFDKSPSDGWYSIECPHDTHEQNGGTHVKNADGTRSKDGKLIGFCWDCKHQSCMEFSGDNDRLMHLKVATEQGWLPIDALIAREFFNGTDDEFAEALTRFERSSVDLDKLTAEIIADFKSYKGDDTTYFEKRIHKAVDAGIIDGPRKKKILHVLNRHNVYANGTAKAEWDQYHKEKKRTEAQERKASGDEIKTKSGRVVILAGEGHSAKYTKAKKALIQRHAEKPTLFDSGGCITRVYRDQKMNCLATEVLDMNGCAAALHEAAAFLPDLESSQMAVLPTFEEDELPDLWPPEPVVKHLDSERDIGLNVLRGIMDSPFFVPGTGGKPVRVSKPGYDHASGFYYEPPTGFEMEPVPDDPSAEEIEASLRLIRHDVLGGFPFNDRATGGEASFAHALCLMLQPFIRPLIPGVAPFYGVTKPTRATGSSLLVAASMLIATGRGEPQTFTTNEEEMAKRITAIFETGKRNVNFDNVTTFDSKPLLTLATETSWSARLLGGNKMASFDNRLTVTVTGNNLKVREEMARRLIMIRLAYPGDPERRPETDFPHPELREWITANRAMLVRACLILIQAWVAKGAKKDRTIRPLKSFEVWSYTFAGILKAIGVEGFLGNRDEFKATADDDKAKWTDFIAQMAALNGFKFGPETARPVGDPGRASSLDAPWHGDGSLVHLANDCDLLSDVREEKRKAALGMQMAAKEDSPFDIDGGGEMVEVFLGVKRGMRGGNWYYLYRKEA